ncbi:MAG: hypothetical protein KG003_08205 [Bacteroidetes bacterium]|nr:hypothetical protein [Bacteroidota bacterium]
MRLFLLLLLAGFQLFLHAQILNQKITIQFENKKAADFLHQIETKSNARFAYNAEIFNDGPVYNGNFVETELITVLEKTLGNQIVFREKGKYIILKSTSEIVAKNEKFVYTISGYVYDASNNTILPFASIFDSATLKSTFSDSSGFYSLSIEQNPDQERQIGISKANYRDTFILVKPIDNRQLSIALEKWQPKDTIYVDSGKTKLDNDALVNLLTNAKQRLQSLNLKRKLTKHWQVSFLPYLGTNGSMSGAVTNNISLNILGGYSGGIQGAEFGGIFNIDRDSSAGAQFAGVYNLTAGPFNGAQFGGVANNHFSEFRGAQFGGVLNTCSGNFTGFQAAGVMNFEKKLLRGTQAAGVINYTDRLQGTQIAGVINTANFVQGTQISGLVNRAHKLYGTQIGFINLVDTIYGVQIGFLSFCKSGVHQVEYSYSDVLQHNATLRTGSRYFYNILTAGYHPYPNEAYSAGYGIGCSIREGRKANLHVEVVGNALYLGTFHDIPMLTRISLYQELTLFKTVSVMFGPDLNFYYTTGTTGTYTNYKDPISYIKPIQSFDFNYGRKGIAWVGFHVGVGLN